VSEVYVRSSFRFRAILGVNVFAYAAVEEKIRSPCVWGVRPLSRKVAEAGTLPRQGGLQRKERPVSLHVALENSSATPWASETWLLFVKPLFKMCFCLGKRCGMAIKYNQNHSLGRYNHKLILAKNVFCIPLMPSA
jgi:hypothetical protein